MILKTKFDNGNVVWKISNRKVMVETLCPFCSGTGEITGKDGSEKTCPECYGRQVEKHWENKGWCIDQETPTLTIGLVRC